VFAGHVFEGGGAVDVVQFLGFVHYGLYAWAFEEGDLANYVFVGLLLGSEVVVGHVSHGFEAVWEGDGCIRFVFLGEPFEYLLVFVVFRGHVDVD
jgi:hypothetical protein